MLQSVRRHLPVLLALLCLATVLPSLFLPFEDSEIWGITSSRRLIDHPFVGSSAHYKPLFSLLFGFIASVANSDWSALIASRWLAISFAAGGLFSLYSIGLALMRSGRNQSITVAVYSIVCTMPLLLLHFSKARSDSVSASLILIAGLLLVRFEYRSTLFRGIFYVISTSIALLITPKSIDLAAAIGVIFWLTEYSHDFKDPDMLKAKPKNTLRKRLTWLIGPFVTILLIGLIISRDFIVKSFVYWLDSYKNIDFFSRTVWVSFNNSVQTAVVPSMLIAVGLVVGLINFRRFSVREKALVIIGWIVASFIALHSQKFLFFLASRAPFLALGALPGIHFSYEYLAKNLKLRESRVLAAFVLLFVVSLTMTVTRISRFPAYSLNDQKVVYLLLEQYLDRSKVKRYWDAIGLFPTRNQIFHYPSPGDRENSEMLSYVESSRPNLILRTSKMELLEPRLMIWLRSQYVAVNPQIYARFHKIAPTDGCYLKSEEIRAAAEAQNLALPIALIRKETETGNWIRVPFEGGWIKPTLDAKTGPASIRFDQCNKAGVEYAISEAGPWDAMPAPNFSLSFGYDGRL